MNKVMSENEVEKLRNEFKIFLKATRPKWSENTVLMHYSDSFYAFNNNVGIDFWSCFTSDEAMLKARDKICSYLSSEMKAKNANTRANGYLASMKHLKEFLDSKYNLLVPEVRLLPMSREFEFYNMSYEQIQNDYFLGDLINEDNGYYRFRNTGISCPPGSLILFQIDSTIIASATLSRIEKFETPKNGIYKGALVFDTDSIEVFNPITAQELSVVDSTFRNFSQVKQKLNYGKIDEIISLIKSKQQAFLPEELPLKEATKYIEGAKYQITVNAYERNDKARQACIHIHGSVCKICGFDFGKFYGEEFAGKIHVHHKKALNEIDDTYEVNPETDLIPVCPNCHMVLHSKVGGTYSVDKIRKLIKKC